MRGRGGRGRSKLVLDGERDARARGWFSVGACLHKNDVICEGRVDGSGDRREVAADGAHRH
jgi:hypothetical protein